MDRQGALPPLPAFSPTPDLATSPRKVPGGVKPPVRPQHQSATSSSGAVALPPSPRGGGPAAAGGRPPPPDSALLEVLKKPTPLSSSAEAVTKKPTNVQATSLSDSLDSAVARRPVSPRAPAEEKGVLTDAESPRRPVPPRALPSGPSGGGEERRKSPPASPRPPSSQPLASPRSPPTAPARLLPQTAGLHARTLTEAPPMVMVPQPPASAMLKRTKSKQNIARWTLLETPNGQLSRSGLGLVKVSPEKGWDCDTHGTEGWSAGVHEWSVLLENGGNGVGLGICLGDISMTDDSQNSNLSFIINCTTGAAYDDCGTKTPIFAVPSGGMAAGSVLSVRLDLDGHTLSFGWNGKGLEEPVFANIPPDCWYPFVALGVAGRSVTMLLNGEVPAEPVAPVADSDPDLLVIALPPLPSEPVLPPVPAAERSAREAEQRALSVLIRDKELAELQHNVAILSPTHAEEEDVNQPEAEDMIRLDVLTERSIAKNLQLRFDAGKIYTFVGDIVCSVNPFRPIPELYTAQVMQQYLQSARSLPPHVFVSAAAAFEGLSEGDQTILATGESGSGKTEATKLVVQWLSFAGSKTGTAGAVNQLMVLSSTILEAFGNAQTVKNCNSSRFGKLFQIFFGPSKQIESCHVTTFLLEVSRVTGQSSGERNFHAFYRMLRGATTTRAKWMLQSAPEEYRYTRTCTQLATREFSDVDEWDTLCFALGAFQIDSDLVFSVLSGILWLGEIDFELGEPERDKNNPMIVLPSPVLIGNTRAVHNAARLLQIDEARLAACFERRTVQADNRATFAHVTLTVKEAEEARDSLARAIYARLFDWLVAQINARMGGGKAARFIGLLDMFGFENFEARNSFPQLLINYGNEELQRLFAQRVFRVEQEQYEKEGVQWRPVAYPDNSACLKLVEECLSLLDEDCKLVMGSDANWIDKVRQLRHAHLVQERFKTASMQFGVQHYAGPVMYEAAGFRSQNQFVLRPELSGVMQGSQVAVVASWFQEQQPNKKAARAAATVSRSYRTQLAELARIISATSQHFVRCIRPNATQQPALFEREIVQRQLASLGLLATCQIRKAAMPVRFGFVEFHERYWQLVGEQSFQVSESEAKSKAPAMAAKLAQMTRLSDGVAVGKSRVFLSTAFHDKCELLRRTMLEDLEKMRLEREARARALEEQRVREERARVLAEQQRVEAERRKREELVREQERLAREAAEAQRKLQDDKAREAARIEAERQQEARRQEERQRQEALEQQKQAEEEQRLRSEREKQRALDVDMQRVAEERARQARADEEAARGRAEEKKLQDAQEEERRRRLFSDLLASRNAAKGFVRPPPIEPDGDWTVKVVGHEQRKAKKSENWILLSVLRGREQWTILKSPACLNELRDRLQKAVFDAGKKATLPPVSTKEAAAMSFFNFCTTDPFLHACPALRQFLLSGLNNCEEASAWQEGASCSGTLVKKKGESKGLKKKEATRHCVIKNRILYYCAKPDAPPRGLVTLDGSIVALIQQQQGTAQQQQQQQHDKLRPASARKGTQQFRLIQHDGSSYLFSGAATLCTQFVDTVVAGNAAVKKMAERDAGPRVLEVELIAAKDLVATDSNVFCIGYIDNQQIETRIAHGANPLWREAYREDPEAVPSVLARQQSLLWLTVWGRPSAGVRGLQRHQFLGMAVVTVSALPASGTTDVWIPLVPRAAKEKVSGAVRVALTFRGGDGAAGQLEVTPYVGASLEQLMRGVTSLPVPVLIAQLLAYFVRNKTAATDAEFFQLPHGPEFNAFVAEVNAAAESTRRFVIGPDAEPSHLMGLLCLALRSLGTPVISYRVFQTLFGQTEGEDSLEVRVAAVASAVQQMDSISRTVLGNVVAVLRLLVAYSPGNATDTVRFGKVVALRGGRAQIRRRVREGEGVTTADVISSFGCVLARPPMETERTVLRLIETNQVLEYVLSHARELFPAVDLDALVKAVDAWEAKGGLTFVLTDDGLGIAPSPPSILASPRKRLPLPEFEDGEVIEVDTLAGKPLPIPASDSDDDSSGDE